MGRGQQRSAVSRGLALGAILLALVAAAGCGDDGPTQPPSGPFTQCPAEIQIDSASGGPVTVNYALPGVSGGSPPYQITCEPPSGASLGVGTHLITCTVRDAAGKTASCSFTARVVQPPRLSLTRFLAFGDSITEGQVSAPATFGFRIVEPENSYPTKLGGLLRARYRGQSLTMINAGLGGESAGRGSAKDRLEDRLDRERPEVLLLMEGTNDINTESKFPTPGRPYLKDAVAGIEEMIGIARSRGAVVMLATIAPARPPGDKNLSPELPALIVEYNGELRLLAQRLGVPLVDVHAAMVSRPELIGVDGLHPTVTGYEVIAQTFFDRIRAELEASGGSAILVSPAAVAVGSATR